MITTCAKREVVHIRSPGVPTVSALQNRSAAIYKPSAPRPSPTAPRSLTLQFHCLDTVRNSSRMIFFPKGTYQSTVASHSSSLNGGNHVTDTSAAESVPIIRSLVHSPSSVAVARSLRGEEARELINIIDHVGIVQSQHGNAPRFWGTKHRTFAGHCGTRTG